MKNQTNKQKLDYQRQQRFLKNKYMTKQQQKNKALKEYLAIKEPAFKEYQSKCNEIDELDIKIIDGKKYKLVD